MGYNERNDEIRGSVSPGGKFDVLRRLQANGSGSYELHGVTPLLTGGDYHKNSLRPPYDNIWGIRGSGERGSKSTFFDHWLKRERAARPISKPPFLIPHAEFCPQAGVAR